MLKENLKQINLLELIRDSNAWSKECVYITIHFLFQKCITLRFQRHKKSYILSNVNVLHIKSHKYFHIAI